MRRKLVSVMPFYQSKKTFDADRINILGVMARERISALSGLEVRQFKPQ